MQYLPEIKHEKSQPTIQQGSFFIFYCHRDPVPWRNIRKQLNKISNLSNFFRIAIVSLRSRKTRRLMSLMHLEAFLIVSSHYASSPLFICFKKFGPVLPLDIHRQWIQEKTRKQPALLVFCILAYLTRPSLDARKHNIKTSIFLRTTKGEKSRKICSSWASNSRQFAMSFYEWLDDGRN